MEAMSSFSAVLGRVAAAISVAWMAAPVAAQCDGVWIAGAPELTRALHEALDERHLQVIDDPSCATHASVAVEVAMSEQGLVRVVLLGAEGATAVRDVDRMTTAALIVESWTRATELDLLEPHRDAPAPEAPAPEPIVEAPTPRTAVATLSAAAIAAFGDEGSSWFGAHLGACAHAGPTCVGGSVRYLSDSGLSDAPSENSQRTYVAGELDVSLPFDVAPGFILTPAVALGLGWLDVVVVDDSGRTVVTDALRALVSGSFAGAVALVDWLSLELRLSATWSPLARQSTWIDQGVSIDPDPVFLGSLMLGVRADIR
jgi:hypothetical protein